MVSMQQQDWFVVVLTKTGLATSSSVPVSEAEPAQWFECNLYK